MAVSFVGAGSAVNSADALSVPWPGSQASGDIGLLLLETNETDTVSVSGVTELASSPQYNVSQAHKLSVFWVEATGSDANISIPDPGNHGIAQILVFSGVDTTAPINATVGASPGVASAVTCAGVTTTVDGCGIVHIVGTGRDGNTTAQFDGWANANLVSITEIADVTTGTAGGGGFGAAWGIKTTAGATGDGTVTMATSAVYTTITVALTPASSGGSQSLTPSLFTNGQTFYTATVSAGVVSLSPSLVTNSQTFYSPTVSVGVVTLTPSLLTNAQTFPTPTVTQDGGPQYLIPDLLSNEQTFYSATVSTGGVNVLPALFTNTQVWYSPIVTNGGILLLPSLLTNDQTFYGAAVTTGAVSVLPALLTNDQLFYGAVVSSAGTGSLDEATILAIAEAVWADPAAIAAHAKLDEILACCHG